MNLEWLLIGTLFLLAGHCVRAMRFAFLLQREDSRGRSSLLFSLCCAYAINAILPWRAGDALRAVYLRLARPPGSRMSAARAVAAVTAERMTDLAVVGPMLMAAGFMQAGVTIIAGLLSMTCIVLLVGPIRSLRTLIWFFTALLAQGIRLFIVDAIWSLRTLLMSPVLRKPAFIVLSALMWALYAVSYAFLAHACSRSLPEVIDIIYGSLSQPALTVVGNEFLIIPLVMAPILLLLLLLPLRDIAVVRSISGRVAARLGAGQHEWFDARFSDNDAYKAFLLSCFAGQNSAAARFGLVALGHSSSSPGDDPGQRTENRTGDGDSGCSDAVPVHGARVRRFFEGGSGAVTALVEVENPDHSMQSRVRKFAMGDAALRLTAQAEWLMSAARMGLPTTSLVMQRQGQEWAFYDMPFLAPCSDAYDAVHVMPAHDARRLLTDVLTTIRAHHAATMSDGNEQMCSEYAASKIVRNAGLAAKILKDELGEEWSMNGENYSLKDIEHLLDTGWATRRMQSWGYRIAQTHGDLTLENIIVSPSHPRGWFLIDPNPGGLFDRPLLDMGKLLQSLHLGYETLSRRGDDIASIRSGSISLPLHRSQAYASLHQLLEENIMHHEGVAGLEEARFHELVHYLRLIPYKARRSSVQGTAFSALAVMLAKNLNRTA